MRSRSLQILLAGAAVGALGLALAQLRASGGEEAAAVLDPARIAASACRSDPSRRGPSPLAQLAGFSLLRAAHAAPADPPPLTLALAVASFPVSGAIPEAQRHVDQGMGWLYGFNHAAAVQAFRAAQRLAPDCAMCFWGEALALGPNINMPMVDGATNPARQAMQAALQRAPMASPRDRALIAALAHRYGDGERADLDRRYAEAMREVAAAFPADRDVAVLFAESLMNLQPWDYWEADRRTPKGGTAEAVAAVERVLATDPDHAGAIHLYIHLMEASAQVALAEPYADRLAAQQPAAGHLMHMPSHIYLRLGRYLESLAVNEAAVRADEAYLASATPSDLYGSGYYPHNLHFALVSAQMAGKRETAMAAAGRLDRLIDPDVARALGWVQVIKAAPYFAQAQMAEPAAVLALPDPGGDFPLIRAMWRYARGVAHAAEGDPAAALAEAEAIAAIARDNDFAMLTAQGVPAPDVMQIAWHVVRGRAAMAAGRPGEAVPEFAAAAAIQEGLAYMEPPYWYYPVRQSLGAALLADGRAEEAAEAFMAALVAAPHNGWALFGLMRAQEAVGDTAAAEVTASLFSRAWAGDPAGPSLLSL